MATNHICCVVPPYLLSGIAESDKNEERLRQSARNALNFNGHYCTKRKERFAALTVPRGFRNEAEPVRHNIVPDAMLKAISESEDVDEKTRECAKRDLEHLQSVHAKVQQTQGLHVDDDSSAQQTLGKGKPKPKPAASAVYRAVYDAQGTEDESRLPGKQIRVEGQKAVSDKAVNEAYDNVGNVLDFYAKIFNWQSIDNNNMHVISSVHFGQQYENAFWDPSIAQMVFGDGHDFLHNFTGCVDVIGHELTHAVTEHTSPLDYQNQAGALNEHVSDVFGIMVKQRVENETADKADWLIGEGCLLPDVKGVALRNMKAPGTAYNDPRFGKDPQPDNFAQYKQTSQDNGGVHLYSGIPNRAFYLASVAFGGYSWEKAGRIWWETMNSHQVPARCTFQQFADLTVDKAAELFGDDAAKTVQKAWTTVGVVRKSYH
ncbi:matellopeptidase-like protein [Apiospora phragmitis]|uniref:Matellopeptidase-like protein n=1 Tax=Apiospora phragmitis TaxID=2905665 RepID=A0ABR1VBV1_9PEZI